MSLRQFQPRLPWHQVKVCPSAPIRTGQTLIHCSLQAWEDSTWGIYAMGLISSPSTQVRAACPNSPLPPLFQVWDSGPRPRPGISVTKAELRASVAGQSSNPCLCSVTNSTVWPWAGYLPALGLSFPNSTIKVRPEWSPGPSLLWSKNLWFCLARSCSGIYEKMAQVLFGCSYFRKWERRTNTTTRNQNTQPRAGGHCRPGCRELLFPVWAKQSEALSPKMCLSSEMWVLGLSQWEGMKVLLMTEPWGRWTSEEGEGTWAWESVTTIIIFITFIIVVIIITIRITAKNYHEPQPPL